MAAQRNRKRKKSVKMTDQESTSPKEETKTEAPAGLSPKPGKRILKAKMDMPSGQPSNVHTIITPETENTLPVAENPFAFQGENERERPITRYSFFVRLAVDKQGQIRKTEIEHVESGNSDKFSSMDKERLFNFIATTIIPVNTEKDSRPPSSYEYKPENEVKASFELKSSLVISAVQVFQSEDLDIKVFTHMPGESFVVQAHFQHQYSEASPPQFQDLFYEMRVYTNDLKNGRQQLLACSSTLMKPGEKEYTVAAKAPGLLPGTYRLFTYVTAGSPIIVSGHFDGPVIRII
jgi:hypothetical protein